MNLILGWSAVIFAALIFLYGLYQYGLQLGYRKGFEDGESYWWKLAHEVEAEREKLWKQEIES